MTIKNRIAKLEKRRGAQSPEVVILYLDNGIVAKSEKHPELIGMSEAELDAHYNGRDDVLVLTIVKASEAK